MARIVDETKLERIKDATLHMVVKNGYGGASISAIARHAGVAEGYLYRHYKGKSELVNDLLYSNLNELNDLLEEALDQISGIRNIFRAIIQKLFEIANHQPQRIKFLYVLMHDYNFSIQETQRDRIYHLCQKVRTKGWATNEIHSSIEEEEIFLLGVIYPIQFINLRLKNFFNQSALGDTEIEKVTNICINSIKR